MQRVNDDLLSDRPSHPGDDRTPSRDEDFGRPRWTSGTATVGVLAALTIIGAVIGVVIGMASPPRHEVSMGTQVDNVLAFPSWLADEETSRFSQALLRRDTLADALETAGLPRGTIGEITATRAEASPLVEVKIVVEDPAVAGVAIESLVDTTLLTLLRSDRVPEQAIVDAVTPELDAVEARLAAIWSQTGTAPGTDLAARYNDSRYNAQIAREELAVATEQWRLDRLPAEIATAELELTTIEPVLAEWYDANARRLELRNRLDQAAGRLQDLDLGLDVLEAGGHRSDVATVQLSRLTTIGRWSAGGAALGIAAGLVVIAILTVRRARPTTRS